MLIDLLPYLDEHDAEIAADVDVVWAVLIEAIDRGFSRPGAASYARAVGCVHRSASGPRPLTEGSTVPGFLVVSAVPGSELMLQGRHRFSSYALSFRLDAVAPGRSRLRAESRATFPGFAGRVYRLLVVGSGGHVVVMRRLLADLKRRSEVAATGRTQD
ncbi:MAG: hypothetical protein JWM05_609 [Acidimicrobiales bacterium]|nr:hypothetical protein [Acidimicrobiales bacterium]